MKEPTVRMLKTFIYHIQMRAYLLIKLLVEIRDILTEELGLPFPQSQLSKKTRKAALFSTWQPCASELSQAWKALHYLSTSRVAENIEITYKINTFNIRNQVLPHICLTGRRNIACEWKYSFASQHLPRVIIRKMKAQWLASVSLLSTLCPAPLLKIPKQAYVADDEEDGMAKPVWKEAFWYPILFFAHSTKAVSAAELSCHS